MFDTSRGGKQPVYLDVTDEQVGVHRRADGQPEREAFLGFSLGTSDSMVSGPMVFRKQSLDIDITSILMKYRPAVEGLPAQLTTDLNLALYAGWRHDSYLVKSKKDPLGTIHTRVVNHGYDFGLFAGPGVTMITPFTTRNNRAYEYSGMVVQTGVARFVESNVASFGLALGVDYLLSPDRDVWNYENKPWVGFVVGIALN